MARQAREAPVPVLPSYLVCLPGPTRPPGVRESEPGRMDELIWGEYSAMTLHEFEPGPRFGPTLSLQGLA